MLFTLDDAAESMELESIGVGIVSVLEAHAMGILCNVVVPSGQVLLGPTSCPYLPLYTFCVLTIIFL